MCPTITNEKVNLYRKDGLSVPCDNSNTTTTILRTETIYRGGLKGSPFFCHTYSEELEWDLDSKIVWRYYICALSLKWFFMKSGTIQFWETPGGNAGGFSFIAAHASAN